MVYLPGVIHLGTVPEHRKVNRVDLGTADKLCAAALGIHQESERMACSPDEVSFILLELGGGLPTVSRLNRVRSWTVWEDPAARSVGALRARSMAK